MGFTAVLTALVKAFPGMRSELKKNTIDSCVSEESSAEIRFGIAVKRGTADDGVLLCTATSNKFRGIVQQTHAIEKDVELGTSGVKPKMQLDVAVEGVMYVLTEEDVTPTSAVRIRCVAGGSEVAGAFRATADSTDCYDISKFARWKGTYASGYALLEFDFRNSASGAAD